MFLAAFAEFVISFYLCIRKHISTCGETHHWPWVTTFFFSYDLFQTKSNLSKTKKNYQSFISMDKWWNYLKLLKSSSTMIEFNTHVPGRTNHKKKKNKNNLTRNTLSSATWKFLYLLLYVMCNQSVLERSDLQFKRHCTSLIFTHNVHSNLISYANKKNISKSLV